jgi:hypothetical protein
MHSLKRKIRILIYLILFLSFFDSFSASAFVRSSTNYRIQSDSINSGGLDLSTSTNYRLRDSIGEMATGDATSTNYNLHAGYRQMDETYISITVPGNIALSPSLGGISGGIATGNGTWTVTTDSESGYSLSVHSTSSPAMIMGADTISDYAPSVAGVPDRDWNQTLNTEFGYSPYNSNSQSTRFKNNSTLCNTGSNIDDGFCWYGLSTSDVSIANRNSRTGTGGENTKINFKAQIISNANQKPGVYTAGVVITATSN